MKGQIGGRCVNYFTLRIIISVMETINKCYISVGQAAGASFWCRAATTLRQGARVIEDSRRLRVVSSQ
jgi:hypothetical protein